MISRTPSTIRTLQCHSCGDMIIMQRSACSMRATAAAGLLLTATCGPKPQVVLRLFGSAVTLWKIQQMKRVGRACPFKELQLLAKVIPQQKFTLRIDCPPGGNRTDKHTLALPLTPACILFVCNVWYGMV